jgi:methionyl aminopeptidase
MERLVKTPEEIARIRESARILGATLRKLSVSAREGVSLLELDKIASEFIKESGGRPVFLGYRPYGAKEKYPFSLCASVNNIIVHGRPSAYVLKSGDVVKLDLGVDWRGGISDSAITVPVGKVDKKSLELIKVTKLALREGIRAVKPGHTVGDIGHAVERAVSAAGFKVIDGLTGHGVGNELHEDPIIFNRGKAGTGELLKEGMVLAIEPMTAIGTSTAIQLKDDSFATADGSIAAHFEHTVLVTKRGAEILSS